MITTKTRNLLTIAAIPVTTSIIAGTLSTYIQQGASAQNQTNSNTGAAPQNLTGSVQVFP
jgi:hypothetical protein